MLGKQCRNPGAVDKVACPGKHGSEEEIEEDAMNVVVSGRIETIEQTGDCVGISHLGIKNARVRFYNTYVLIERLYRMGLSFVVRNHSREIESQIGGVHVRHEAVAYALALRWWDLHIKARRCQIADVLLAVG